MCLHTFDHQRSVLTIDCGINLKTMFTCWLNTLFRCHQREYLIQQKYVPLNTLIVNYLFNYIFVLKLNMIIVYYAF